MPRGLVQRPGGDPNDGLPRDPRMPDVRVAAELRAHIENGTLATGAPLPAPIAELAKQYGTHTQMIQRAIRILKTEGCLESRHGKGVFVRAGLHDTITPAAFLAPVPTGESYPWAGQAASRGRTGSVKLLGVEEVAPPPQVARGLGISGAEHPRAIRRTLLMFMDDKPAELVKAYYPLDLAAGTPLGEFRAIKGGAPRVLADMGLKPAEQVDLLSARSATTEEYLRLELVGDTPVLRTFRVVLAEGGRPVAAEELVKAGHLFSVEYRTRA